MTPALAAAGIAAVAITLYAVLGGADFGGGVWDLFASGPRQGEQRGAIALAIGPVWEANHIWLVFAIVILFTCFPGAFASLATGLYFPMTLALAGIVLRGAGYIFRGYAHEAAGTSFFWGRVFGVASVITPIFFGCAAGGVFSGRYDWTSPFALSIGLLALAVCAQEAAVFLTLETDDLALREDFRRRALGATLAIAIIGAGALLIAFNTHHGVLQLMLSRRGALGIGTTMLLGLLVLGALLARWYQAARILVVLEVVGVLGGWYVTQAPFIAPGITFTQAAAPDVTLVLFLWTTAIGALFLIPSLVFLFVVFKGRNPAAEEGA